MKKEVEVVLGSEECVQRPRGEREHWCVRGNSSWKVACRRDGGTVAGAETNLRGAVLAH